MEVEMVVPSWKRLESLIHKGLSISNDVTIWPCIIIRVTILLTLLTTVVPFVDRAWSVTLAVCRYIGMAFIPVCLTGGGGRKILMTYHMALAPIMLSIMAVYCEVLRYSPKVMVSVKKAIIVLANGEIFITTWVPVEHRVGIVCLLTVIRLRRTVSWGNKGLHVWLVAVGLQG